MAKPWEQYQQSVGPWTQYQQAETPADMSQQSEIPQRRQIEQFTGVRGEVGPAMKMLSPEQKTEALKTGVQSTAAMMAGPLVGTALRSATTVPSIMRFGQAIESGGLAPSLNMFERLAGGGTSGLISGAVVSPEQATTGAAIGVATPAAARAIRPFLTPIARSQAELAQATQAEYQAVKDLNANVSPGSFGTLISTLEQSAKANQYLPSQHPKIAKAFDVFREQAALNEPVSIDRLDKLRQRVAKAINSSDFNEREIAKQMVGNIDAFIKKEAPQVVENLEKARDLYTQLSRSKPVERIIRRAQDSKTQSPSEVIQNEFGKISRGEGKFGAIKRQFTKEQQAVIDDIAKGRLDISALETTADWLAPSIGPRLTRNDLARLMAVGGGLGTTAQYFGPQVALPIAAAMGTTGVGARTLANRLAMVRAQQLAAMTRSGNQMVQRLRPDMLPQFAPVIGINALGPQTDFAAQSQALNALGQ